jgi:hypothetical protein
MQHGQQYEYGGDGADDIVFNEITAGYAEESAILPLFCPGNNGYTGEEEPKMR